VTPQGISGPDTAVYAKESCWTVMVAAGGLKASDEEGHAVRGCVHRACRAVIANERELVINFTLECVCMGMAYW
jgi:hypothetical protein